MKQKLSLKLWQQILLLTVILVLSAQASTFAQRDVSALLDRLGVFYSAGATWLDPMLLGSGSIGFNLDDTLKGVITVGYGIGEIESQLDAGQPISTGIQAISVEGAALYPMFDQFYFGPSVGLLSLAGRFDVPFSTSQSLNFDVMIPTVGVMLGYDLGAIWLTLSASVALGG